MAEFRNSGSGSADGPLQGGPKPPAPVMKHGVMRNKSVGGGGMGYDTMGKRESAGTSGDPMPAGTAGPKTAMEGTNGGVISGDGSKPANLGSGAYTEGP